MADQRKKVWEKPELIVVTRNKPEENVLASCKDLVLQTSGPAHKASIDASGNGCSSKRSS